MKYIQFKKEGKMVWFDYAVYQALNNTQQHALKSKLLAEAQLGSWIATVGVDGVSFSPAPKMPTRSPKNTRCTEPSRSGRFG